VDLLATGARGGTLARGMAPLREEAQAQKLMERIGEARKNKQTPVLSVSRDGVALGLAPWSFFEMASVACISVLADGKKLGTVYLGCVPESNQVTLSNQLTSLLQATIRASGDCIPEIVYVSDAGKVETANWKNTLRKWDAPISWTTRYERLASVQPNDDLPGCNSWSSEPDEDQPRGRRFQSDNPGRGLRAVGGGSAALRTELRQRR